LPEGEIRRFGCSQPQIQLQPILFDLGNNAYPVCFSITEIMAGNSILQVTLKKKNSMSITYLNKIK